MSTHVALARAASELVPAGDADKARYHAEATGWDVERLRYDLHYLRLGFRPGPGAWVYYEPANGAATQSFSQYLAWLTDELDRAE